MNAHQAFIRLVNLETEQELIFVAEPDHTSTYKFELVGILNFCILIFE